MSKKSSSSRKRSRPVEKTSVSDNFFKNKTNLLILIIAVVIIAGSVGAYVIMNAPSDNNEPVTEENPVAVIETSMGTIKVELYKDKVPTTVDNFVKLANDGFYDGLVFHRVTNLDPSAPETHIVQGGGFDTEGNQKESSYGAIDLEINDDLSHVDGAIAMARTNDPNSATNQFYICDGENKFLDDSYVQENFGGRGYAVFGVVTDGIEVVRSIALVDTTTKYTYYSDWPLEDVIINSITIQ